MPKQLKSITHRIQGVRRSGIQLFIGWGNAGARELDPYTRSAAVM